MKPDGDMTIDHPVVSHEEWLDARRALLEKEKAFTRQSDEMSRLQRSLPWERVTKEYVFEGPGGRETLADLFAGRSQLIVYHFMFHPDDDAGCPHCSLRADGFAGIGIHLHHRDVTMVVVSRAPYRKLEAYRTRMGWTFKWVSSAGSDFNFDYQASFTPADMAAKRASNFETSNFELTRFPVASESGPCADSPDIPGGHRSASVPRRTAAR
jgi:predicted dithiol-disulfide oxidoreductase (DUF899 family)